MEAINGRSQVIAAGAALSAFRGASQHNWIMRLDFPFADGPTAILLPNKLFFHKAVSCCFRDVLKVLSDDPRVPLKIVMGKIVTVSLGVGRWHAALGAPTFTSLSFACLLTDLLKCVERFRKAL